MGHALELPAVSAGPCSCGASRVLCTAAGCTAPWTTVDEACSQPQFQQISPPRKPMVPFEEPFCAERAFSLPLHLLDMFIATLKKHQAGFDKLLALLRR